MESAEISELRRRVQEQLRDMIRDGVTDDCSICLSDLNMPCITLCGHAYCRPCITEV